MSTGADSGSAGMQPLAGAQQRHHRLHPALGPAPDRDLGAARAAARTERLPPGEHPLGGHEPGTGRVGRHQLPPAVDHRRRQCGRPVDLRALCCHHRSLSPSRRGGPAGRRCRRAAPGPRELCRTAVGYGRASPNRPGAPRTPRRNRPRGWTSGHIRRPRTGAAGALVDRALRGAGGPAGRGRTVTGSGPGAVN